MHRSLVVVTSLVFVALTASSAKAQVSVSLDPAVASDVAEALGLTLAELETQLGDQLSEQFAALNPNGYMKAIVNAQLFSNKGIGVDYASNPTVTSFGIAGNVSAGIDSELDDDVAVAPGLNVSLMFGLNAGVIDDRLRDLTVYTNFWRLKSSQFAGAAKGTLTNFAVHGQFKMFRPKNTKKELILQWGGLDLTSGIEFSRLTVDLGTDTLLGELPIVGDEAQEELVDFGASGTFTLSSTGVVFPFEASTNLRIAYFATMFGGAGFDIQTGTAEVNMALSAGLDADDPNNPGQRVDLGTATIEAAAKASPSVGNVRFFGGLQANLWRIKLLLQANVRPSPAAVGLTLGARVAW